MALFKIAKGPEDNLSDQPIREGYAWFTEDGHNLYIDIDDETRVQVNANYAKRLGNADDYIEIDNIEEVIKELVSEAGGYSKTEIDTKLNGYLPINGTAAAATKLTSTNIGSSTNPVYFNANGQPTACAYTLAQSVTASSKLTDTTYSAGTGLTSSGTTFSLATSGVTAGKYGIKPNGASTIVWRSNNAEQSSRTAQTTLTAKTSGTVSFDYENSGESTYDYLSVELNGSTVVTCSGNETQQGTYSGNITSGQTLIFKFQKDGSVNKNNDCGTIYNLKVGGTMITPNNINNYFTVTNDTYYFEQSYVAPGPMIYPVMTVDTYGRVTKVEEVPFLTSYPNSLTYNDGTLTLSGIGMNPLTAAIPSYNGSTAIAGLVPARSTTTTTRYLREDGTWQIPSGSNYNISLTGDITGSIAVDGSSNITANIIRRGCVAGTNGTANTNSAWYKVASYSTTTINDDANIIFNVYAGFGDSTSISGILEIHIRTGNPNTVSSAQIQWLSAGANLPLNDFIIAYSTSTNPTIEFWVKNTTSYRVYHFDVIGEGNRIARETNKWTLYDSTGSGVASPTSGYTQVISTVVNTVAAIGTDYTTSRLRNISAGTGSPSFSNSTNGSIFLQYEA